MFYFLQSFVNYWLFLIAGLSYLDSKTLRELEVLTSLQSCDIYMAY